MKKAMFVMSLITLFVAGCSDQRGSDLEKASGNEPRSNLKKQFTFTTPNKSNPSQGFKKY